MYKCLLLSSKFSILVQFILFFLSISVLCTKRFFEMPRRSPLIFFLDISKQGFSSIFSHYGNIAIAMILSNVVLGTECGWYFISSFVDTIVGGLFISYILLKLMIKMAHKYDWIYLKNTGDYGNPINYSIYFTQLFSWVTITIISRSISGTIIYLLFNFFDVIVVFIDSCFMDKSSIELVFVMVIWPITINIMSVLVIDIYLKMKNNYINVEEYRNLDTVSVN